MRQKQFKYSQTFIKNKLNLLFQLYLMQIFSHLLQIQRIIAFSPKNQGHEPGKTTTNQTIVTTLAVMHCINDK
jgi:hypothetical protein